MVLTERNSELVRNGRRSRGPSPNTGHNSIAVSSGSVANTGEAGTSETSSDDDNSIKRNGKSKTKQSEYEEKIRVGRDYQAVCPPLVPESERKLENLNDRALLVWSPTKDIPDSKLEEYISVAKEKYGYNGEQALGMLFWHKHDLERAVMDLANFTPFPDEWTVEDKVLFEQAFQFHGKSFHRIRQMLPDKSIASLVKYYYSWKKTRHRQSVMDRQEKAKTSKEGSENGSDNGSNEDSDNDDKDQVLASSTTSGSHKSINSNLNAGHGDALSKQNLKHNDLIDNESTTTTSASLNAAKHWQQTPLILNTSSPCMGDRNINGLITGNIVGYCDNCGVQCNYLNPSPQGKLCSSCHHHWRRTGNRRPTSGPYFGKRSRDRVAERIKPPRGMYINHDDIVILASTNSNCSEFFRNIDREISSLLTQVQLNKQTLSALKRKNFDANDDARPIDNSKGINTRWTNEEILLATQGVRKYGKDFHAIAETIGTKTEAHVRSFYITYRRRYNLDEAVRKHIAEKEMAIFVANDIPNDNKKEDSIKKTEHVTAATTGTEESNYATSSEKTVSKNTNDEEKTSAIRSSTQKDDVLEVDSYKAKSDAPPPAKKIALLSGSQENSTKL